MDPTSAAAGAQDPHEWDAHGQIVVDALLDVFNRIQGREDLDTKQGRLQLDLRGFGGTACDADIGNAKAPRIHLHPHYGHYPEAVFPLQPMQPDSQHGLQLGVIELAGVPLLQFSVDKIAIRTVAGS